MSTAHSNTKDSLQKTIEIQQVSKPSPALKPQGPKPRKMLKSNINDENATRPPPLDIVKGEEVLVVNGDRSNLTWKRYNLIEINQRTGMCVVEGIANNQQRNFPRSVVKPKVCINCIRILII